MSRKWEHPLDWLQEKIRDEETSETWLRQAFLGLAFRVDGDTIQDVFQPEMEEDGYFESATKLSPCCHSENYKLILKWRPGKALYECLDCSGVFHYWEFVDS